MWPPRAGTPISRIINAEWREFAGCTPGGWIAAEVPALSQLTGGPAAPAGDRAERVGGPAGGR